MSRRTIANAALVVLMLGGALAGVTALRVRAYGQVKPRGQTFRAHLSTMPEPVEYRAIRVENLDYLAVRGPAQSSWAFASGPPIYIFDAAGVLVDHTVDSGDDPAFHAHWPGAYDGQKLDRAGAERWPSP